MTVLQNYCRCIHVRGIVSKETVVLHQWRSIKNKRRDLSADVSSVRLSTCCDEGLTLVMLALKSLHSVQIILSTLLIKPNIAHTVTAV